MAFSPPNSQRRIIDHAKYHIDSKKSQGVNSIPYDYGKVYIGETGWLVQTKLKEHNTYIIYGWIKKSALTKHSNVSKHHICLESEKVIVNMDHYTKRQVR